MAIIRTPSVRADPALILVVAGVGLTIVVLISRVLGVLPTIVAVGIPIAVAVAVFLVRHPTCMVTVMIVAEMTNLAAVVAQRIPVPISAACLALGLATVVWALRDPTMRSRVNRGTGLCVGLIACYLITQLLATLDSRNSVVSLSALEEAFISCLFLVVILVLIQLTCKPWTVAAAIVLPLMVMSALCIVSQVGFGSAVSFGGFANVTEASGQLTTTPRFSGPLQDSNFWGRHLVMALPLAGALVVHASGLQRRCTVLAWLGALLVLLAGVYLTQSRGTLIATAIALFVWVLASGATARRRGLMSLPLVALVVLVPGIGNRMVALVTDVADRGHAVDPSVLGRMNAQEMAWAMFRDRPVMGFGPDVFSESVPRYAGLVPTAVLHPTDAPHNLYAQIAADSGVVGIAGWIFFVGGFIAYLWSRLARLSSERADSRRSLGAAVLAGLIAWSFASVFLHLAYFRTFAIMLALAGALASAAGSDQASAVRQTCRDPRPVVLAAVFGGVAATAVLVLSTGTTHTVSQRVTLLPTTQAGGEAAYALDLKTREALLPTYAAMMEGDTRGVTAIPDSVRGVITLGVVDVDMDSAREGLVEALAEARMNLAAVAADSWYTIVPVGGPTVRSGSSRSTLSDLTAIALGGLVAAGAVRTFGRRPSREQRRAQEGSPHWLREGASV